MTIRTIALNTMRTGGFGGFPTGGVNFPNQPGNAGQADSNVQRTNANIREAGADILSAINYLTQGGSELQGRTSNADVATVQIDNSRTIASMPPQDTVIDVRQIATAQTNVGEALTADERAVNPGAFSFAIEAGGVTRNFNINVLAGDDNASIQQRMANAINTMTGSTGVRAEVSFVTNAETGEETSTLTLTGTQTGAGRDFTVRDISGNLAEEMGIDSITQRAQNARFTINGGTERQSATNDISIAAGVNVELQGAGRTEILFGRDNAQTVGAVTELVNAINSAMRSVSPRDGRGSERFLRDLHGLTRAFEPTLARVGISVMDNGQLSIDRERLQAAAQDGSVERLFDNRNMGFAGRVERIGFNAVNTASYMNAPPPVNLQNNNFDFGNTNNTWNMMNLFG